MTIQSRKEAQLAGVGQYFTGKPCKHGHISNRYTQSGTCAACVGTAAAATRGVQHSGVVVPRAMIEADRMARMKEMATARHTKVEAMKSLQAIKVFIYDTTDKRTVFETTIGLCLAEYPGVLERHDVLPSSQPIKGSPFYVVLVPPDQVQLIRDMTNHLWGIKSAPFMEERRAQIFGKLMKMADETADDETPPMNFK
jgi:hypothetical protein